MGIQFDSIRYLKDEKSIKIISFVVRTTHSFDGQIFIQIWSYEVKG
jgi:hypothetical protein